MLVRLITSKSFMETNQHEYVVEEVVSKIKISQSDIISKKYPELRSLDYKTYLFLKGTINRYKIKNVFLRNYEDDNLYFYEEGEAIKERLNLFKDVNEEEVKNLNISKKDNDIKNHLAMQNKSFNMKLGKIGILKYNNYSTLDKYRDLSLIDLKYYSRNKKLYITTNKGNLIYDFYKKRFFQNSFLRRNLTVKELSDFVLEEFDKTLDEFSKLTEKEIQEFKKEYFK